MTRTTGPSSAAPPRRRGARSSTRRPPGTSRPARTSSGRRRSRAWASPAPSSGATASSSRPPSRRATSRRSASASTATSSRCRRTSRWCSRCSASTATPARSSGSRPRTPACRKVKRHPKSSHANPTPATDGKHLVAFFGSEGLYCYDLDGKPLWKKDLGVLDSGFFAVTDAQWGFASSPVIHDGKVVLQCDVQNGFVPRRVRLRDGAEVWRTQRQRLPDVGHADRPYRRRRDADPVQRLQRDRRLRLRHRQARSGACAAAATSPCRRRSSRTTWSSSPAPTARSRRSSRSRRPPRGEITPKPEETSTEHVALVPHARRQLHADADRRRRPALLLPRQRRADLLRRQDRQGALPRAPRGGVGFTASPVAAGDKLYFTSEDGQVHVVKAGPTFERLAENPLGEVCMATPAISGNLLLFRTQSHLIAVGE